MYNFYHKIRKTKFAGLLYKVRLKKPMKFFIRIIFSPKLLYLNLKSHLSPFTNRACDSIINISPKDINKRPVASDNLNFKKRIKNQSMFKFQVIFNGDFRENIGNFKIEDSQFYKAAYNVFLKNDVWENQEIYKRQLDSIKKGIPKAGCITQDCLNYKYIHHWSNLYKKIKLNGYLSQKNLNNKCWDEIKIAISEKGDYLFIDGQHRLAFAKLLNIAEIPVFVVAVHKNYKKKYLEKFNVH